MNPSFVMNPSLSDTFSRYLRAQAALPDNPREPLPLAITISREAGAGGMAIAELLAQHLTAAEKSPATSPWAVFNANLAKQVLEDHKLPLQLEQFMTEDVRLPIEDIVEEVLGLHPPAWSLVRDTTKTILRLAALGHAVVVGRGGNIVTARLPNVFHVRLVAPYLTRVRFEVEKYHLTDAEAAKLVRERDQGRRRYLRRYFNVEIDDPTLYDVTLNTGRLGLFRSAEAIEHLASDHYRAYIVSAHRSELHSQDGLKAWLNRTEERRPSGPASVRKEYRALMENDRRVNPNGEVYRSWLGQRGRSDVLGRTEAQLYSKITWLVAHNV